MTDAYAAENGKALQSAGFEASPGNTYLAHFAGPQGAIKVLRADPNGLATDTLGVAAATANPFLTGMTNGQLRSWADRKMGAPQPPAPIPMPQQAAPNLPLFAPNAMASAQPQMQSQFLPLSGSAIGATQDAVSPATAGRAAPRSLWSMLGLPSGVTPNLPLFTPPDRQQSYGG